jgi:Ser/Thr protein kinase RdoA (MazF antagonist)
VDNLPQESIGERHNLRAGEISPSKEAGIFNAIYLVGSEHVLRVPRESPPFVAAIREESVAVPVARAAGVRTLSLVVFDDSLDLLPVPYAIYERVHGETLGMLDLGPEDTQRVWQEVGRDLARLHEVVDEYGPVASLECEPLPDPRPMPDGLASAGYFTSEEAWADATHDFAGKPFRAVPFMLEGYREVAPLPDDETAEARILWRQLQIALYLLGRPPQPGLSWAERPAAMLLEIMRFFLGSPGRPWMDLYRAP